MTTPDPAEWTAEQYEQVFHAALAEGDTKGIEAALVGLAVRDPHRAETLLEVTKIAIRAASDPTLRPLLQKMIERPAVAPFRWLIGERESFDFRLREVDTYVAVGDFDAAARALDLMINHASRCAGKLRTAAGVPDDNPTTGGTPR